MQTAKPRILVVDDETSLRDTVETILQREGYDTSVAPSGAAAIEALRHCHYDLVLTDLKMPDVDGLKVLQHVRNCSPDTVTVMMTGYGSINSALEAVQLGAYEYLLKPTSPAELIAAVRRSLERKRLSEIDTLYRIGRTLAATNERRSIQNEVAEAVKSVLNLASACLVVFDRHETPIECEEHLRVALTDPAALDRLHAGTTILPEDGCGAVAAWAEQQGKHSFVLVPGTTEKRLVCVLEADNQGAPFEFHAPALRFLRGVVNQSTLALENASLVSELRRNNRELAAANQKLLELDKLKSEFLSIATHELRTPLSVILGYSSMLAENLCDRLTPEEKDALQESVQACKRLMRLVNSTLDIAQIDSGKMKMVYEQADLRQIASGVVALFQPEAHKKGIQLGLELPEGLSSVQVDAERIEQVLVNLIGNAFKFTAQGSILVRLQIIPEDSGIEISVADTGVGILPEELEHIFDEFTQVRARMSDRHRGGHGLGLAISRRIAEAHGGQLYAESSPGQGSTFRMFLPLEAGSSHAGEAMLA
jgi:signal transduction histidine kinase/DNA-binding response OmpR family regulator